MEDKSKTEQAKSPWLQWKNNVDDVKKLEANQLLLETSSRVRDAMVELSSVMHSIEGELVELGECDSKNQRLESIVRIRSKLQNTVNKPILPLMHIASESLREAGLTLAPMMSTTVLHERNEAERKRSLGGNHNKNLKMRMIEDFVQKRGSLPEKCTGYDTKLPAAAIESSFAAAPAIISMKTPNNSSEMGTEGAGSPKSSGTKVNCISTNTVSTNLSKKTRAINNKQSSTQPQKKIKSLMPKEPHTLERQSIPNNKAHKSSLHEGLGISIPPPVRGPYYTKPEAVSVARSYPSNSINRGAALKAMIEKGYVPASKRTVQRLIKLAEEGKPVPNTQWISSNGGAPPILNNDDIDAIVKRIIEKNARVYGKEDIVEMLVHASKAKMKQKGEDPNLAKAAFSTGVVHNYMTIFKSKLPSSYWA